MSKIKNTKAKVNPPPNPPGIGLIVCFVILCRYKVEFHRDGRREWNLFRPKGNDSLEWRHFNDHANDEYRGKRNYCCEGEAEKDDGSNLQGITIQFYLTHVWCGSVRGSIYCKMLYIAVTVTFWTKIFDVAIEFYAKFTENG